MRFDGANSRLTARVAKNDFLTDRFRMMEKKSGQLQVPVCSHED